MASMPSLSPNSKEKEDEVQHFSAPVIKRLSNVNLVTASLEKSLVDGDNNKYMDSSPLSTSTMSLIPTASKLPGSRGDEPFVPLMTPANPYKVLSVPKSQPSFVQVEHDLNDPQAVQNESPFSWFTKVLDCCKGKKKNLTEEDLKDFEIT